MTGELVEQDYIRVGKYELDISNLSESFQLEEVCGVQS